MRSITTTQKLLDQIQALTYEATHSEAASTHLKQTWQALEERWQHASPDELKQINTLSKDHNLLASLMMSCEETLAEVCERAQTEITQLLDNGKPALIFDRRHLPYPCTHRKLLDRKKGK
jgi:hypothetical protein